MSINYVDDKVSDAVLRRPRETLFATDAHFGVRAARGGEWAPASHALFGEGSRKASPMFIIIIDSARQIRR
ncbi:MAG: hypothetical protein EOR68_22335 [Mesorhizobium sp.]|uniref:hypothetical protein n=1 Tax=Mesorhizobium sp. TaxID=1871066 RepID=UPI000FE77B7C|nr:hypothetical protein [Mesorhizobium sp.]RWL94312.1 MAG: hypothetical protein EOR68_22335 [Mesorhizobium sp.]TIP50163.1 MAG: hypothetical protein E5X77_07705 [Mesorhizobium sp.]